MEERFQKFTLLINNIARSIHKIKAEEMAEFNLKSSHVSCLYYLYKEDELTAKRLCDICDEDKANISRSIKYLENEGYLVCDCKRQKRYQSPLKLTDKGSRIGEHIARKIDNVLSESSVGISENDRENMYKSLAIIANNLQRICGEYEDI